MAEGDSGVPIEFQKQHLKAPRRPLTRREAIALAFTYAVTAPFILRDMEKAFLESISRGMNTPGATDAVVERGLSLAEKDKTSENPAFRPLDQIIAEGVKQYSEKTGTQVTYQRSPDYRDVSYYADSIKAIASHIQFPKQADAIIKDMTDKFPTDAKYAFLQSDLRITSFEEVFAVGSGFYERFKQNHTDLIRADGYITDYGKMFEVMRTEGKTEIHALKRLIEEERVKSGSPVSASFILENFLEKNKGNLAKSIYDTALFLKFIARSNYETAEYASNETHVVWHQQNLKDEYQGTPYTAPGDQKDLINFIGKPYHTWNLVSMLQFFPNEMVQMSGIYRQLATMKDQGLSKTRADLQTLIQYH